MGAAIKFVGLLFLFSLTFVAADYSSILSSLYQKANQNKRPLILVLDKTNDGSKASKRLVVANRDNNNRYRDYENQRYRDTNSRPYNDYVVENRNTDYRSSSNSRSRDLVNNRNDIKSDRIKSRQSSYDLDRNSYRSVSLRDSNRNHVARLLNRQSPSSPKRHSSVRVSDRYSNRYQRTRSNSHEIHHDHFNYYSHSDPNHYYVHEPKHDSDIHYHNEEHTYHNPNEVYYKVYEPAHVHHYVDSQEKKYYGPQVVSVPQSHEGHSYRGHNAHEHYPLRDIKSSKKHNRSPNDQNRYDSQLQSNIRLGYDKELTRARSKKYLRSSVVKSLLRVANDIQCDALNECEDECGSEKKNDCEDECQENFECQEEKQLDKCEKDECAESTENDNPSTRGVVEADGEDNCNNCKFDK